MVKSIDYYIDLDNTIIKGDADRDLDFLAYDKMAHSDSDLPGGLPTWVRKNTSPDPANVLTTSTQVLSSLDPLIQVLPLASNTLNKERANKIEQCLLWQFYSASRRRASPVIEDLIRSSLTYDAIAMQIIDLDFQIEVNKAARISSKRFEFMRRYSRFLMNTYHPLFVHTRQSNYGPECVVTKQVKSASTIWKEFGDQVGKEIIELAEDKDQDHLLNIQEHWDDEVHCVYVLEDNVHPIGEGKHDPIQIIKPFEHKLGFLPWVIRFGSNTMEYTERYKYNPILAAIHRTGQWETFNLANSLMVSKAISLSGAPDLIEEGPISKSTTEIDYSDPMSIAKGTPGNTLKSSTPGQLDPRLYEMRNELKSSMASSTVSNVLRNAEALSNEAFASFNLRVLTALGALKPYKRKSEYGLEDACDIMMHWIEKSGKPLESYQANRKSPDYGQYYSIEPDEVEADSLIYKVELKADLPIDQLPRVNAANQLVAGMGLSKERGLEMVGIGDASQVIEESYLEKMKEFEFSMMQQEALAMMQAKIQSMQAQQQMAMQQAQAAANPQGVPGAEGMNPAEGGTPPAMMNPGATMEGQTGMSRAGDQNAGGGMGM